MRINREFSGSAFMPQRLKAFVFIAPNSGAKTQNPPRMQHVRSNYGERWYPFPIPAYVLIHHAAEDEGCVGAAKAE